MTLTGPYEEAIERTLFTRAEIKDAIERLAWQIAEDHRGQPLMLVGVLKGALYVVSDLARAIAAVPDGPSEIFLDYICVSSYGNSTRSSGEVRMLKDTSEPVTGRAVVIVEDIVDNGLTLEYLRALLQERNPASLRSCVLLDKPYHRRVHVPVEYRGLQSPDEFVVGYGLDYQELFRNLPYLAQLRPEAFGDGSPS
ncbi:MAG TPA: hypoxanthine phosphoribosyltransferase [Candidatus Baltobacteraceae bacterium]|jgi:hypoxanthine phosphoribosyltransferase|nr:hypoxanthine phosphoribosyltransferase [Candidatus Baltobacteraceae bacterium]